MTQAKLNTLRDQFEIGDAVRVHFRGYGGPPTIREGKVKDLERTCLVVTVGNTTRKVRFDQAELVGRAESETTATSPFARLVGDAPQPLTTRPFEKLALPPVEPPSANDPPLQSPANASSAPSPEKASSPAKASSPSSPSSPLAVAVSVAVSQPRKAAPDDIAAWLEMGRGLADSTKERIALLRWEAAQKTAEADELAAALAALEHVAAPQ